MTNYYVDATGGSDGDTGLLGHAWKTFTNVNGGSFSPGDSILLKKGETWREQLTVPSSGSEGSVITFGTYGSGADPVITGTDDLTTATYKWTASGSGTNEYYCEIAAGGNPGLSQVRIALMDGTALTEGAAGSLADHEWDWGDNDSLGYSTLYIRDDTGDPDTSGVVIEAGQRGKCILAISKDYVALANLNLYGWNQYKAVDITWGDNWSFTNVTAAKGIGSGFVFRDGSNVEISSCTLTGQSSDSNWSGILFEALTSGEKAENCTITGCTISGFPNMAIDVWAYSVASRGSGITISGNTCTGNGGGIYLHRIDGASVYNNDSSDNTLTDYSSVEGYGLGFQSVSNCDAYGNTLSGNSNCGIEIWGGTGSDGQSDGNAIHQNQISENALAGIFVSSAYSDNNSIYHNLIYSNSQEGLYIGHDNTGNKLLNNSLYGNGYDEIKLVSVSGWTIQNNAIYAVNQLALHDVNDDSSLDAHSYNCYYRASGTVVDFGGVEYTLAQITTWEAPAIAADPSFAAVGSDDFTLTPSSPCIDAGTDVSLTADYLGVKIPQFDAPDIGAYEFSYCTNKLAGHVTRIPVAAGHVERSPLVAGEVGRVMVVAGHVGRIRKLAGHVERIHELAGHVKE